MNHKKGEEREREIQRIEAICHRSMALGINSNNLRLLIHWEAHFGSRLTMGEKHDRLCLQIDAFS